jgi:hypothetical protein
MPRIIVIPDPSHLPEGTPVLLDEEVHSVHLSTGHAAGQLLQRLTWAVDDAEAAERRQGDHPAKAPREPLRLPLPTRPGSHLPVGA